MAKFNGYRKSWNDYERTKCNDRYQKRKPPNINTRFIQSYDDIYQPNQNANKLIKISCSTNTPDIWEDLLKELQYVIVRNGGSKLDLKPINPYYNNNQMEFYLQLTKSDQKILKRNHHQITKYTFKCNDYCELHVPPEFPSTWITHIHKCLQDRFKTDNAGGSVLNLSRFCEDEYLKEQGLVLKLSLPRVMENMVTVLKPNLQTLTKLDLSHNQLNTLYKLQPLLTSVSLEKLDLSHNRLRELPDLAPLKETSIKSLDVSNNDVERRVNFNRLRDGIRRYLPGLRMLNGKNLEDSVIIAGETSAAVINLTIELPASTKHSGDHQDVLDFLMTFFGKHDMRNRDVLCDCYSTDSSFTLSSYDEPLAVYRNNSYNLSLLRCKEKRRSKIKKGKVQIMGIFAEFPMTIHVASSLCVDVIAKTSEFATFFVTGVFIEQPIANNVSAMRARSFGRWITTVKGGTVLQDHLNLMPSDNRLSQRYQDEISEARSLSALMRTNPDLDRHPPSQVKIVDEFRRATGLKVTACLQLLRVSSDLTEAAARFKTMREAGQIPADMFESR